MSTTATADQLKTVQNRPANVAQLLLDRVESTPDAEAFRFPDADERWQSLTWVEAGDRVLTLAAGLIALGVEPEQRVAIASNTRVEWVLADLAINCAGAATTTVYPSTTLNDETYILADSTSRVVFAEDDEQVDKLLAGKSELPDVFKVVAFESGRVDGDWVIGLDDLAALGAELLSADADVVTKRVENIAPDDLATLIYTSGTTGRPKGVRLAHSAWTYEGAAVAALGFLSVDDLEFRWLPMAHSFGKVLSMVQLSVGFPAAIDGRVPKIVDNLGVVRPTFMGAAPRIFEKAYGRIISMTEEEGGAKLKIFRWAESVGLEYLRATGSGGSASLALRVKHAIADRLVFSKVRDRFGGRVRFFISGAAALSPDINQWFSAAGVCILEGYGLTETSAGTVVNRLGADRLGSVGQAVPGSEIRIAEDGEILLKGEGVMLGYHNLEAETDSVLDDDGWLHTGDEGRLDEEGYLFITGRKKELFKTSNGKYVAPPHIEGLFKSLSPMCSQILVHGNERTFCSALISLDVDAVTDWAKEHDMADKSYAEVVASEPIQSMVADQIDQLNARLNRWETIKKWAVLDHDMSVDTGELTPSMKVKRKVVEEQNAALLDAFYA